MGPGGVTEPWVTPDLKPTQTRNFHARCKTCSYKSQTTSKRKSEAGGLTSQLQNLLQSCSDPDGAKDRRKDQWNRMESPGINLHIYSQLIFDKNEETIQ